MFYLKCIFFKKKKWKNTTDKGLLSLPSSFWIWKLICGTLVKVNGDGELKVESIVYLFDWVLSSRWPFKADQFSGLQFRWKSCDNLPYIVTVAFVFLAFLFIWLREFQGETCQKYHYKYVESDWCVVGKRLGLF